MAMKPVNVSQLNKYISGIIATDPILSRVLVKGEVSNFRLPKNGGYVFFSLKDERSTIRCFVGSSDAENMRDELSELEDGTEIICSGCVNVYEPGGYYSLTVRSIEISGRGDLAEEFEKLKKRLEKEGLFDREKKKTLPPFPEKIAVVTSENGAAVRDITEIITQRSSTCSLLIYPVLVQGRYASADIAAAIRDINENMPDVDIIICGRGGGSMEDLWAFNEETCARAVYESDIPIISAVGHETDFTITDFCADVRAETPTAAAQIAVPRTEDIYIRIEELKAHLDRMWDAEYNALSKRLLELDMNAMKQRIGRRIDSFEYKASICMEKTDSLMRRKIEESEKRTEKAGASLEAASPVRIMEKGYAAVTGSDGKMIKDISSLEKDDLIHILGKGGQADAVVREVRKNV